MGRDMRASPRCKGRELVTDIDELLAELGVPQRKGRARSVRVSFRSDTAASKARVGKFTAPNRTFTVAETIEWSQDVDKPRETVAWD